MSKDPVTIYPEPITITTAIAVNQSQSNAQKDFIINDQNQSKVPRTIPPRFAPEDDCVNDDNTCGLVLKFLYIISISATIWIFANAHPKYKINNYGVKEVSDHYLPKVEQCCSELELSGEFQGSGLCALLEGYEGSERRLNKRKPSFVGDEGIFDAFLDRPDIIFYLSVVIISFTFVWVYSLQKCAKYVVLSMEVIKTIAVLGISGILISNESFVNALLLFSSYCVWVHLNISHILKGAEVITQSAIVVKNNSRMIFHLFGLKVVYALQTAILLVAICTSYEIVEVRSYSGGCYYVYPEYLRFVNSFQIFVWIWTVWTLDMVRLFIVASVTGSNYFHPNDDNDLTNKPTFYTTLKRALGPSFGTLAFAGLITSFLDVLRKRNRRCFMWFGPQIIVFVFIEAVLCVFGACILNMAFVFTKFSVVLHAFTGKSFQESGQRCHEIMRRRFVGGYITEINSHSVLWLSSVFFSIFAMLISWDWMNKAFHCNSFDNAMYIAILIIIGLFSFHPVIGILLVICVNSSLQNRDTYFFERGEETYQHVWVPPLAAAFVGIVTKLLLTFVGKIILDAVDTMIVCFAIDEDNDIQERSNEGMAVIIKDMKDYIKAEPVVHFDIEAERIVHSNTVTNTDYGMSQHGNRTANNI
jgi:hypothetical protein